MNGFTSILLERIQVLLGMRGKKGQHAVRFDDLTGVETSLKRTVQTADRADAAAKKLDTEINGAGGIVDAVDLAQVNIAAAVANADLALQQANLISDEVDTSTAAAIAAADTAKVDAEAARDDTFIAAGNALNSANNALASEQATQVLRDDASGFATAAASDAAVATAKATEAGQEAVSATNAKVAAQTAQGGAEAAQVAAATSATDASGSASTAATEAALAANSYTRTRLENQDPYFEHGLSSFSHSNQGPAITLPDASSRVIETPSDHPTVGGQTIVASGAANIYMKTAFPVETDRKYRFRCWIRRNAYVSGTAQVYAGFSNLDVNLSVVTGQGNANTYCLRAGQDHISFPVSSDYTEFVSGVITGEASSSNGAFRQGTAYIRPLFLLNYLSGSESGNVMSAAGFVIEDVTESEAAALSASASTSSAQVATTQANASGVSAASADADRIAAQAARSASEAARDLSVSAKQDAVSAQAAALASANLAAQSENNAGVNAQASADSATLASTMASDAGVSADAADQDRIAALAAQANASVSATNAASAASSAAGDAATATSQAIVAVNAVEQGKLIFGNFNFNEDKTGWKNSPTSSVEVGGSIVNNGQSGGKALRTFGDTRVYYSEKLMPLDPSRTYRIKARVRRITGATPRYYLGMVTYDANGAQVGGNGGHVYNTLTNALLSHATNWIDYESAPFTIADLVAGTRYVAPLALANYLQTAAVVSEIDRLEPVDVTEEEARIAAVTATNTAIQTVDGKLAATSAVIVDAGNATGELRIGAFDDPNGATGSFVEAIADDIFLTGNVIAQKMLITGSDFVFNGNFETGDLKGWTPWSNPSKQFSSTSTTTSWPTKTVLFWRNTEAAMQVSTFSGSPTYTQAGAEKTAMKLVKNRKYRVSWTVWSNSGTAHITYLFGRKLDGSLPSITLKSFTPIAAWTPHEVEFTMPNDWEHVWMYLNAPSFAGTTYWTNISVKEKDAGDLLVDGAIKANHMAVGSITAANGAIADLAVDTLQIAGNAVTVTENAFASGIGIVASGVNVTILSLTVNRAVGYSTKVECCIGFRGVGFVSQGGSGSFIYGVSTASSPFAANAYERVEAPSNENFVNVGFRSFTFVDETTTGGVITYNLVVTPHECDSVSFDDRSISATQFKR